MVLFTKSNGGWRLWKILILKLMDLMYQLLQVLLSLKRHTWQESRLHDCYDSSVDAALRIVDILKEKGFEFVTVDELILD